MQLPRLDAEEALSAALRVSVGSGVLSATDSRSVRKAWQKAADDGLRRKERTAPTPAALGMMGIGYRVVDKNTHG